MPASDRKMNRSSAEQSNRLGLALLLRQSAAERRPLLVARMNATQTHHSISVHGERSINAPSPQVINKTMEQDP
jgi:hypothetical protein